MWYCLLIHTTLMKFTLSKCWLISVKTRRKDLPSYMIYAPQLPQAVGPKIQVKSRWITPIDVSETSSTSEKILSRTYTRKLKFLWGLELPLFTHTPSHTSADTERTHIRVEFDASECVFICWFYHFAKKCIINNKSVLLVSKDWVRQ